MPDIAGGDDAAGRAACAGHGASAWPLVLAVPQFHTYPASVLARRPRPGATRWTRSEGGITAERGTSTPHARQAANRLHILLMP